MDTMLDEIIANQNQKVIEMEEENKQLKDRIRDWRILNGGKK